MKKIFSLVLALAIVMALAACSSNDANLGGNVDDTSRSSSSPSVNDDAGASEEVPSSQTPSEGKIAITSLNANKEEVELVVPYDPQRIAVLDMATLDILDALGVGGRVVGAADTSLDYLQTTSAARCPAWAPSKRPAWRPSWPVTPT